MESSESIAALAAALSAAQGEMAGAKKDSENPHFRSKYADLASIWDAARPVLPKHGLAVMQLPEPVETGYLGLTTILTHSSGEFVRSMAVVPLPKNDPQGYGSALTYTRRYSLAAILGIAPEDDDAEAATSRGNGAQRHGDAPQSSRAPSVPSAPKPAQETPLTRNRAINRFKARAVEQGYKMVSAAALRSMLEEYGVTDASTPEEIAAATARIRPLVSEMGADGDGSDPFADDGPPLLTVPASHPGAFD